MFYQIKNLSRAVILACLAIGAGSSVVQAEGLNWETPTNVIEAYESNPLFSYADYVPHSTYRGNWRDVFAKIMAPSEKPPLGTENIFLADLKPHLGQMNTVYHSILNDRGTFLEDMVRHPAADISSGDQTDYMLVDLKPHLQASEWFADVVSQPENPVIHLTDLKPHLATAVQDAWN